MSLRVQDNLGTPSKEPSPCESGIESSEAPRCSSCRQWVTEVTHPTERPFSQAPLNFSLPLTAPQAPSPACPVFLLI